MAHRTEQVKRVLGAQNYNFSHIVFFCMLPNFHHASQRGMRTTMDAAAEGTGFEPVVSY